MTDNIIHEWDGEKFVDRKLPKCRACGKLIISEYGCPCQVDELMAEIIHDMIQYHD